MELAKKTEQTDLSTEITNNSYIKLTFPISQTPEAMAGDYVLVTDTETNLGTSFRAILLSERLSAKEFNEEGPVKFLIGGNELKEDPEYQEMKVRADDWSVQNRWRPSYGREVLLYHPTLGVYATFFMGNYTMRRAGAIFRRQTQRENDATLLAQSGSPLPDNPTEADFLAYEKLWRGGLLPHQGEENKPYISYINIDTVQPRPEGKNGPKFIPKPTWLAAQRLPIDQIPSPTKMAEQIISFHTYPERISPEDREKQRPR